MFGYNGKEGWKENKRRILALLDGFSQEDELNNRYLIRSALFTSMPAHIPATFVASARDPNARPDQPAT